MDSNYSRGDVMVLTALLSINKIYYILLFIYTHGNLTVDSLSLKLCRFIIILRITALKMKL